MRLALIALAVWLLATPGRAQDGPILVMGDSVMAWNGGQGRSIGDALGRALGREVVNASVPGAQIAPRRRLGRLFFDIGRQYEPRTWDWVVLNGGANDLMARCGCRACEAALDALIAPDGRSGQIVSLIVGLREAGARVLYVGYYGPSGRGGGFDACEDELAELDARVARLSQLLRRVHFVDSGDVISRANPADYARDNVHPSPAGSARIAALAARAIGQLEAR